MLCIVANPPTGVEMEKTRSMQDAPNLFIQTSKLSLLIQYPPFKPLESGTCWYNRVGFRGEFQPILLSQGFGIQIDLDAHIPTPKFVNSHDHVDLRGRPIWRQSHVLHLQTC